MYTRENYALAKAEIEKRRLDAIATAEERNSDLALESNEIREIDAELSGTGLLLFKTACLGGDIDAIRARNMELQEKRRKILVKLGYPEDYTDVHYTCKACSDAYDEKHTIEEDDYHYWCGICGWEKEKDIPVSPDPEEPVLGDVESQFNFGLVALIAIACGAAYICKRKFVK